MNARTIIAVSCLFASATLTATALSCPPNEEYNSCGTACPPTCDYKPEICTDNCVPGCFCKKGFMRETKNGSCIPEERCKALQCPPNEEYLTCGTACPPTCQNKPELCTLQCVSQCFCKEGFIRECENGRCIPEENCKFVPKCGANEQLSNCSTLCPRTCNNDEPRICPLICLKGCVCKEGFVREKLNGRCIPEVACKNVCKANRIYKECGTNCPGTCSEPVKVCDKKCVKGCFCKDGYLLSDETNKCIKAEDCP